MRRMIAMALLLLAATSCSDPADPVAEPEDAGPQPVTLSGTFEIQSIDGRPMPAVIDQEPCQSGTVDVIATYGRLVFTPGTPGEPSPFESRFVRQYICAGFGLSSTSVPRGTYTANDEMLFVNWPASSVSGWVSESGARFLNSSRSAFEVRISARDSSYLARFFLMR